jgi:NADH dehydrogenase FAD-containing subunit
MRCGAAQEGDTIGVHMALRADQSYRHDASRNVHLIGDCATVIFSRNGAVVGRAQHVRRAAAAKSYRCPASRPGPL